MDDRTPLNKLVASEIRAWMGRRQLTGRQLAARIGASQTWTATRLRGEQEITVNDLQRIASALDVSVLDLMPPADRASDTTIYSPLAADGTPLAGAGPMPTHPIGPHIPNPRPGLRAHHRGDAHASGRRHHPTITAGEHRTGRAHRTGA